MHLKAFKQFETQINAGAKLMYHTSRKCYDLARNAREVQQKEQAGFELLEHPPVEALGNDVSATGAKLVDLSLAEKQAEAGAVENKVSMEGKTNAEDIDSQGAKEEAISAQSKVAVEPPPATPKKRGRKPKNHEVQGDTKK